MYDDEMSLPTPLSITINAFEADGERCRHRPGTQCVDATSEQYPELSVHWESVDGAVEMLLEEIRDAQPMSPSLVAALLDAGYSQELVQQWNRVTWGHRRMYRFDTDATLSVLAEYAAHGVPALAACEFFTLPIPPGEAGQIHAAGGTPDEARRYHDASATDKWWQWDFEVMPWLVAGFPYDRGRLYFDSCSVEDAVAWEAVVASRSLTDSVVRDILQLGLTVEAVAAGFPTERVGLYAANRLSAETASAWEDLLGGHDISDSDLRDMVRAGFMPQDVGANIRTDAASGPALGAAARLQLALASPHRGDPWDAPDRAPF